MVSNSRQLAQVPSVPSGRRNLIINGAMNVAQRGDDIAVNGSGVYSSPDRFRVQQNANSNSSLDQVTDVPSGEGFEYALKYTNGTGEPRNGGDFARCYYRIEGYDSNHLELGSSNAKAVTLSFWVKSSLTGTFGVGLAGASTGSGVYSASYTISSANTWEYKTISVPAGTINVNNWAGTNGIGVQVHWDLGEGPDRSTSVGWNSSANPSSMGLTGGVKLVETTGATWFLTGVQLEVGTVATEFEHRGYGEELALCQRYFYRDSQSNSGVTRHATYIIAMFQTTRGFFGMSPPVPMRAIPTISLVGTPDLTSPNLSEDGSISSATLYALDYNNSRFSIDCTTTASTANTYRSIRTSQNEGFDFDAEM